MVIYGIAQGGVLDYTFENRTFPALLFHHYATRANRRKGFTKTGVVIH